MHFLLNLNYDIICCQWNQSLLSFITLIYISLSRLYKLINIFNNVANDPYHITNLQDIDSDRTRKYSVFLL